MAPSSADMLSPCSRYAAARSGVAGNRISLRHAQVQVVVLASTQRLVEATDGDQAGAAVHHGSVHRDEVAAKQVLVRNIARRLEAFAERPSIADRYSDVPHRRSRTPAHARSTGAPLRARAARADRRRRERGRSPHRAPAIRHCARQPTRDSVDESVARRETVARPPQDRRRTRRPRR